MRVDRYADEHRGFPAWLAVLLVAVALGVGTFLWQRVQPLPLDPEAPPLRAGMARDDAALLAYTETLRGLRVEGPYLSDLLVERGIRAMDGEQPSPGEVKVMCNLHWPSLPGRPSQREALDRAAARAAVALLASHPEITKLRLVIKVPKARKEASGNLGVARGHRSAAKLFSFTRPAYEAALELPSDATDAEAGVRVGDRLLRPGTVLALGDYVVEEDGKWVRGF